MNEEEAGSRFQRYVQNLEKAFRQLDAQPTFESAARQILDLAKRYFDDAKYFKEEGMLTTALISLAYSEGLLDALRLLGKVGFDWDQSGSEK